MKSLTLRKIGDGSEYKVRVGEEGVLFQFRSLHSKEVVLNMEDTHLRWSVLGMQT